MEILHISPSYKPAYCYGGTTVSISSLCEALQRSRGNVTVFTTTANGKKELKVTRKPAVLVDGVHVRYFRRITKDHIHFSPAMCLHLFRHIRKRKNEGAHLVLHIHSWWNLVSILSCSVGLLLNIPVIVSPRGMLTKYTLAHKNGYVKRLIHILVGRRLLAATHIHATSDREKKDILQFISPKSITIIPNLLAGFTRVSASRIPLRPFRLIFFSRIDKKKGLDILFEAVSKLNFEYHLTIAGTGSEAYIKTLKALAHTLKIESSISWIGQVDKEKKYIELSSHHLFVLASHNENFANVVLESLSVGTPVLISEQVGLSDYILHSGLGWVSKQDPDELAKHMNNISEARDTLEQIKNKAPAQVRADFDTPKLIRRYLDYYNDCFVLKSQLNQGVKAPKLDTQL